MNAAETLLRDVRAYLTMARDFEALGEIELADASGAIAANKLARSIRVDEMGSGVKSVLAELAADPNISPAFRMGLRCAGAAA